MKDGSAGRWRTVVVAAALLLLVGVSLPLARATPAALPPPSGADRTLDNSSAVSNFTSAVNRLVELVGVAGSGLLALVWARVALSWFSHDVTKKVQAKERARDALIGTLIFAAALTGLVWGLAHWVFTGS
jgi:hypothetical protein